MKTEPGESAVAKVMEARIYGYPVEALCGERFVPAAGPEEAAAVRDLQGDLRPLPHRCPTAASTRPPAPEPGASAGSPLVRLRSLSCLARARQRRSRRTGSPTRRDGRQWSSSGHRGGGRWSWWPDAPWSSDPLGRPRTVVVVSSGCRRPVPAPGQRRATTSSAAAPAATSPHRGADRPRSGLDGAAAGGIGGIAGRRAAPADRGTSTDGGVGATVAATDGSDRCGGVVRAAASASSRSRTVAAAGRCSAARLGHRPSSGRHAPGTPVSVSGSRTSRAVATSCDRALERAAPGEQLEEHEPERVHVGGRRDVLALHLLRRHVRRGADRGRRWP